MGNWLSMGTKFLMDSNRKLWCTSVPREVTMGMIGHYTL